MNRSIEVGPTRLEPIIESTNVNDLENVSTVIYHQDQVR